MPVKIYVQANLDGHKGTGGHRRPGSWIFRIVPEQGNLPEPSSGDAVKSEEVIKFEEVISQFVALQEAAVAAFESYEDVLDLSDAIVITNNENAVPGIREALGLEENNGGVEVRVCKPLEEGEERKILDELLRKLP
jgi:hypothetical protein